jgi:nitroimidazol reductase NimA-like FMN-containing flavoprotein (pyridoxamine 5'-phosphate oxidase superfamily)
MTGKTTNATAAAAIETERGRGLGDIDGAGLEVLDRDSCLGLLTRGGVGRLAINDRALPMILPVRFALDDEWVVVCVGSGSTLDRATRDAVVAFEVDGSDAAGEWSVTLVGMAHHVPDGDASARAEALALPRWWSDRPHRFVAVSTEQLTGRRAPPWP